MQASKLAVALMLALGLSGQAQALVLDFTNPVDQFGSGISVGSDLSSGGSDAYGYSWQGLQLETLTAAYGDAAYAPSNLRKAFSADTQFALQDGSVFSAKGYKNELASFQSIAGVTSSFDLLNVSLAYADVPMHIAIDGWRNGKRIEDDHVVVNLKRGSGLVSENLHFEHIDEVSFRLVSGGRLDGALYPQFGIAGITLHQDRVCNPVVAAVPESDTYVMLLAGLGLLGLVVRRKTGAL